MTPNPSTLVIFHRSDLDGLCCEAIARKFLGNAGITYLGWDYGQPLPDLSQYQTIYLLDISLPRAEMVKRGRKLIWIDHHKSAMEEMKDLVITGVRVDGVAACRLAWQWFSEPTRVVNIARKEDYVDRLVEEPYVVQLLGEYDIWDKRNPAVDPFQLGMQAEENPDWNKLLNMADDPYNLSGKLVDEILDRGTAIQAYTGVNNAKIVTERGFDIQWEGLFLRVLNTARSSSLTFTASLRPEHDGCLSYFWSGKKWCFSLYGVPGKDHIDLSLVAKRYGGGGHKQACGGTFASLPRELGGP